MAAEKWLVTTYCPQCRTRAYVDLPALAQLLGADYVLWGKPPRCTVWVRWTLDRRCEGRVEFVAQSGLTGSAVTLKMSGMVRDAIRLKSQAQHLR